MRDFPIPAAARRIRPGLVLVAWLAGMATGCRTPDLTAGDPGRPPVCEVHRAPLEAQTVAIASGESVYRSDYLAEARARFPHHGIRLYQGERPELSVFARQARVFVCPQCTQAYQEYWNRHQP